MNVKRRLPTGADNSNIFPEHIRFYRLRERMSIHLYRVHICHIIGPSVRPSVRWHVGALARCPDSSLVR